MRPWTNRSRILLALLFCLFSAEGCASLPFFGAPARDPEDGLPGFRVPDAFAGVVEEESSAVVGWQEFFEEPALVALIDMALKNNQELKILLLEIEVAKNEVRARSGEYLPFVNIEAGASTEKSGEYTRDGAVEEHLEVEEGRNFDTFVNEFRIGAAFSWEIDVWGKLRNAKKAAVMRTLATQQGRSFMVTHLVAQIAESYYELSALDVQRMILTEMMRVQQNALDAVRLQKEAGEVTELAVRRFEAEVRKNGSRLALVRQEITEAENRINFLTGRFPQPIVRNPDALDASFAEPLSFGSPRGLLSRRPDILRAELELTAAKLDVKVARARFYPKLDLKSWVGWDSSIGSLLFSTPESLLVNVAGDLVLPVLNWRQLRAEYDTATAEQLQALYRYQQTVLGAYLEVVNQVAKQRNLAESLEAKRRQVDALVTSVSVANQLFASARADYTEVLLTQREALEARLEYVELRQEQLSSFVRTYRALGGGYDASTQQAERQILIEEKLQETGIPETLPSRSAANATALRTSSRSSFARGSSTEPGTTELASPRAGGLPLR